MSNLEVAKPFLGRYELQKKIAVGGMAELYLARVRGVGGFEKQVVVKRVLPQLAESEELFNMFLDEARIAATLQHPNVVQVYDACHDNGEYFMAMEYLDGTDLRTLRKVLADRAMPLPWEHALHIIVSIASGLHYAHDKRGYDGEPLGIVHRDVTPHNIFLTREGSVKLVDFGIAKAEGRKTETAMGTLKGKLAYMSPEQCVGEVVDRRSDIYSLGIILYELTTGKRLYRGSTEYQLIKEIVEGEIKPPSSFMEYPPELEELVLRCLEKNPNDRFQSAREIQSALEAFGREYQLMFSSLAFSSFLEPLLAQAATTAEERWRHRNEAPPIRVQSTGQAPMQAARTHAPLPSLASLANDARHTAGGIEVVEEPMTARVPEDMLARLRAEEKQLALSEQAQQDDAVPRMARGSSTGSVSNHVVRRASSPAMQIGREPVSQAPSPNEVDAEELIWESSNRPDFQHRAQQGAARRRSTMMVEPLAMPILPELSDEDMRVTSRGGGIWIAGLLLVAVAGGALWYSQQEAQPQAKVPTIAPRAEVGSLIVAGETGSDVWMFLGRTPIQTVAINSVRDHKIRLEHEGYHSVERILDAKSWQRDQSGTQFAHAQIQLVPLGEEMVPSEEALLATGSSRPAALRIESAPTAANAWLFVGTTPDVKIGNLNTNQEVQLRIERDGQPPTFRVVRPEEFSIDGETRIQIALPKALAPAQALAAPKQEALAKHVGTGSPGAPAHKLSAAESSAPGQGAKVWRPKKKSSPSSTTTTRPGRPGKPAPTTRLEPPAPTWAE